MSTGQQKMVRCLFLITPAQDEFIKLRAQKTGASKNEILRRMLNIAMLLKKENGNGNTRPDNTIETENKDIIF
jgi:negative regulator of replication initiation